MEEENITIGAMQGLVSKMVKRYRLETTPELRYIDLTTEVGELGKELLKGSDYGKKKLEKTDNLELEMGDVLFSFNPGEFCKENNDLFVSPDGRVKPCRFNTNEIDLLNAIKGRNSDEVVKLLRKSIETMDEHCTELLQQIKK